MNGSNRAEKSVVALARRLASRGATLSSREGGFQLASSRDSHPPQRLAPELVVPLIERGLVIPGKEKGRFVLSESGRALVRRFVSGAEDFGSQHRSRKEVRVDDAILGAHLATANADESPLAWLRRRKGRDGRPMISAEEFAGGERLRADYTRGQLMPRVTANWTAAVASARRSDAGGNVDLTEAALEARRRVNRALNAVGPEFGGLLVDFCCFLKGLEDIERDRLWPARSAKVVLRLALAALARHYGLSRTARGAAGGPIRHWGSNDYRPALD